MRIEVTPVALYLVNFLIILFYFILHSSLILFGLYVYVQRWRGAAGGTGEGGRGGARLDLKTHYAL